MQEPSGGTIRYFLPRTDPIWELPEVPVPESPEHDEYAHTLKAVLSGWLIRSGRPGAVHRNLATRWDEANPKVGVDPDVCYVDVLPPDFYDPEFDSLRLWLPDHRVPSLAVEIVEASHPYKDYRRIQDKYAVVGTQELWVYDPGRFGPKHLGGPMLLQVWERNPEGVLVRTHFGDEPAHSNFLGAWLLPRERDHLVISDDRDGERPWLTEAE